MSSILEPALELQRLKRLKDVVLRSTARLSKTAMIPDDEWLADMEARIATLEHNLGLDKRSAA